MLFNTHEKRQRFLASMKKLSLLQTERHLSSMSLAAAPFFRFSKKASLALECPFFDLSKKIQFDIQRILFVIAVKSLKTRQAFKWKLKDFWGEFFFATYILVLHFHFFFLRFFVKVLWFRKNQKYVGTYNEIIKFMRGTRLVWWGYSTLLGSSRKSRFSFLFNKISQFRFINLF